MRQVQGPGGKGRPTDMRPPAQEYVAALVGYKLTKLSDLPAERLQPVDFVRLGFWHIS